MSENTERRCGHSALRWNKDTQKLETFDKYPIHLGEDGTEQFTITTYINEKQIDNRKIHDPFIRSTVKLRGLRWAWRALFGIKIEIFVNGSEGASRAIMTLNPEVLEEETRGILESRRISREKWANSDYGEGCTLLGQEPIR